MEELMIIYQKPRLLKYIHNKINGVSSMVTNTDKLEQKIYNRLGKYVRFKKEEKVSVRWMMYLVDTEVIQALKEHRIQNAVSYSDLAVTNGFGESLEYEPEDEVTDVEEDVERNALQRKIARLASDDFERYVLTAWSRGERSIDIAKDLAVHGTHDVAYFKLKVARFKTRCKKRWTRETFVS